MGLDDLLSTLERRAPVTPVTPCNPGGVTPKPAPALACTPVTPVTPQIDNGREDATEPGRHWALHFLDREPLEVIFSDDLTFGEVLAIYPAALAAVPWQEPAGTPEPAPEPTRTAADGPPVLPTCRQCRKLAGNGRCLAAAIRREPVPDIGRRCETFLPLASNPDQRPGAERWPGLADLEPEPETQGEKRARISAPNTSPAGSSL